MHNQAPIQRRKSTRIYVGNVPIGDGAPIAVQSMTNTRTTDVEATFNQIRALERVGADIVRVSVPTMDAAEAFKLIKQPGLTRAARWWLTSTSTIALR
ncbi:flavodoxin-dependent (E)-4-hydroxy-3-methylbut-2-enyl-diphosphate synthase [Escherichia coli]|nr:flavodoxin-dependent (E)-4-hydroxy-3-methylbut-2-enyl-diphosphate synthase [Escherichia coli]